MSQKNENKNRDGEPNNFHVRAGVDRAKWLREQARSKGRSVPAEIKRIIDKEMLREELANEKPRKK